MEDQVQQHILAKYKISKKIGSGAYGHVYKIQDRKTREILALKKNFDAFSNSTDAQRIYRQIFFLKQLDHPNIIKLKKLHKSNQNMHIYLVFEYMDIDLHHLIRQNHKTKVLEENHKKYIIYQVCKALLYLHANDIIHRDLKPSNILVNGDCDAKLCDFGLVRLLEESKYQRMEDVIMTDYIATRWYRAPELIMGCPIYQKEIDIWALGCMVAQIIREKPLFQGNSTTNQLQKILSWTGNPSNQDLKSIKTHINPTFFDILQTRRKTNHKQMLPNTCKQLLDLVQKMLEFSPQKRIHIEDVLKHPYLKQFYNEKEINAIKNNRIKLKLPFNDNTKLTVDHYRNIIYKEVDNDDRPDKMVRLSAKDIRINPNQKNKTYVSREKQSDGQQHRTETLKESKLCKQSHNLKKHSMDQNSKTRGVSEGSKSNLKKKGISLYSKSLKGQNAKTNCHNNSLITTTITSVSNEKYQRLASKEGRVNKKVQNLGQPTKKKNSFHSFLSSANKAKTHHS